MIWSFLKAETRRAIRHFFMPWTAFQRPSKENPHADGGNQRRGEISDWLLNLLYPALWYCPLEDRLVPKVPFWKRLFLGLGR